MAALDRIIGEYFAEPEHSFWQWRDNGRTIAWRDGKTIAFAEELSAALERLAPSGLPKFGSLLLLFAATRDAWGVDGSEAGQLIGMLRLYCADKGKDIEVFAHRQLNHVLAGLHHLRRLEPALRTPLEAKLALAELVFEDSRSECPKEYAPRIADALRPGLMGLIESATWGKPCGAGPQWLLVVLDQLEAGLERVHPDAVRLRMKTGLLALPGPIPGELAPETLTPSRTPREFIEQLLDSPEHGGIARAAKQLIAGTTLPRRLSSPQQQETGGFSDIANRGTPDRLLLSELAQDGLTLAVRVAMNEAMYLHREVPPDTPRVQRAILVDSGVRAWGTPRVMIAAAALALLATAARGATHSVWRGRGAGLQEVDLTTETGLTDHLAVVEADPHLAEALPAFLQRIQEAGAATEAIVLIPEEALADPVFERALRDVKLERLYVATVNRDGEYRLTERWPRGEKLIRRAKIDLDALWASVGPKPLGIDDAELPAVLRTKKLPFRLPAPVDPQRSWSVDRWGALSISGDGRLLRWTEPTKGADELADNLGKGKLWWGAAECVQGKTSFIYGLQERPRFYRLDIAQRTLRASGLQCAKMQGVAYHNGMLFCVGRGVLGLLHPETGELVREVAVPRGLRWKSGRFFIDGPKQWHALSSNGENATLDPLPHSGSSEDPWVHIWDGVGMEGPVALTRQGAISVIAQPGKTILRFPEKIDQCHVNWVSPDGLCASVTAIGRRGETVALQYRLGPDAQVDRHYGDALDGRVAALVRQTPIRKRFAAIGLSESGRLALRTAKGVLAVDYQGTMAVLCPLPGRAILNRERPFETSANGRRGSLQFATAVWGDSCRAELDRRGLLHLIHHDPSVPEVSLVLAEGELTGACSNGQKFGREYFLRDDEGYLQRAAQRRELCEETVGRFVEAIRAAD
ncbi:hypothetical protein Pla175_18090 [Pirellulimonas nuda]|uniref:Uncharacterized protein n=1 Tax=Pirellulimonas nuda TaxID=2528009 RepID=A0A518DAC2_9BACT|nr:hypothetical protein [Pirellulimonas nuda]QDU88431.1 hypothetical protein Pla175_18090 [Pirellulimonas nuda]